jgi:16S rRNA (guanine1207-N2)-methyltransferase
VARSTRGEFLPSPLPEEFQQPGIAPNSTHSIEISRPEGRLTIRTHPGIFSWEKLDQGTEFLLEHLEIQPGDQVWDVGCGYGVIGLSAILAGAEQVIMTDINLLATAYTQINAETNQLSEQVKIYPADSLSPPPNHPKSFDLILSNPAFHQGHSVDKSMADQLIMSAPRFLSKGGRLIIVANRFLNYDKFMREHFTQVNRIAENNKYHLIEAKN